MNQALRNMFEHHINEMDDPMFMEVVEVDAEAGGLVTLVGQIDNLRVEGIHAISLTNVYFNFMSMEIDFDVLVPRIFAQAGQYDLSGRFGGLIPIFGKGPFTVETSSKKEKEIVTNNSLLKIFNFSQTSESMELPSFVQLMMDLWSWVPSGRSLVWDPCRPTLRTFFLARNWAT